MRLPSWSNTGDQELDRRMHSLVRSVDDIKGPSVIAVPFFIVDIPALTSGYLSLDPSFPALTSFSLPVDFIVRGMSVVLSEPQVGGGMEFYVAPEGVPSSQVVIALPSPDLIFNLIYEDTLEMMNRSNKPLQVFYNTLGVTPNVQIDVIATVIVQLPGTF